LPLRTGSWGLVTVILLVIKLTNHNHGYDRFALMVDDEETRR